MAHTTITLPELGEGVDSVDVVAVLVSVGDTIELDQGLIEVETEKASVEVPSTAAGTVTEIHVTAGDVLGENAPIVTLDVADDEIAAASPESASESASESAPESAPEWPPNRRRREWEATATPTTTIAEPTHARIVIGSAINAAPINSATTGVP